MDVRWMKFGLPVIGLLMAVSAAPAVLAQPQTVTVTIGPGRDAATGTGTAVLTAQGNRTQVVLTIATKTGDHPAHIHADVCPGVGDVVFPLTNVRNGTSTTMIDATLATIMSKGKSINVHESAAQIGTYIGCGNLAAAAATQVPGALPRTGDIADIGMLASALGAGLFVAGYALRRRR